MRSLTSICVSIIIIILLNGCNKETCEPIDTIDNSDNTFIVGVDNGFADITILDPAIKIIAPWHDHAFENFDIDMDGETDFEIHSDHGISPGGINYQESYIKIVNSSFQISVIEMSDTLHRCMQVAYDTVITYVFYNNYSTYTCCGDGIDTTYSPNLFYYPSIHSTGDSLTQNETWSGDDLTLSYYNQSYLSWNPPFTAYSIIRGNWNIQNMKYILFKKEYYDTVLYGWMRLSIDNYKEIRVHEYAIQKGVIE